MIKFLVLVALMLLFSCGNDKSDLQEEELEILNDEIFAVSLQILPEHEKKIPRLIDSLNARTARVKPTRADSLRKAVQKLDSVRIQLKDWQKNFDSLSVTSLKQEDEKMNFLKSRKESLLSVRTKTNEAIKNADNLLMMPDKR